MMLAPIHFDVLIIMKKRTFLTAATLAAGLPIAATGAAPAPQRGPTLLTLGGAVERVNRAPFDPALDRLMHKHQISFERAHTFDFAALTRLPARAIAPTLEQGQRRRLRGPLLEDVLNAAGARGDTLLLHALDGFAVSLTREWTRTRRLIVATHLDGAPIALGGLGPLWAMYQAEPAQSAAAPQEDPYALCPWALYHIGISA